MAEILSKSIVPTLETYIIDDWDFLVPTKIPFDSTMISCDISSLDNLKPTELGIEAISYWLRKKQETISQWFRNDFIIESLKFLLRKQRFT